MLGFGKDKDVQEKVRFDGLERTIEATSKNLFTCKLFGKLS